MTKSVDGGRIRGDRLQRIVFVTLTCDIYSGSRFLQFYLFYIIYFTSLEPKIDKSPQVLKIKIGEKNIELFL